MKCFINKVAVTAFVLSFIILGCASDRRDFSKAKTINDIASWEEFLKKHPKSPRAEEARAHLQELKNFKTANNFHTPESYEEFINKHPNSELASIAKDSLEACRNQIAREKADVVKIRELVNQLRFNEAHRKLVKCLREGNQEAHFELARTLLTEFRWIRQIWKRKTPLKDKDRLVLERERPHEGIIRVGSLWYELQVPYSRQPLSDVTFEISGAWQQFDYLRLIIQELRDYLKVTKGKSPNVRQAKNWLSIMRPIAGNLSYRPYRQGFPSVEPLKNRLAEVAALSEAMDSGKLSLEEPGGN
jgi:hypothetical protein